MEQAGQVTQATHLVGQPGKTVNFIWEKISNHMELSPPDFTTPIQPSKQAGLLSNNHNPGRLAHQTRMNIVLGWHIFRHLTENAKI